MTDKITVAALQAMKPAGKKIVMVTCYDYTCARIADKAGVDAVLVGETFMRSTDKRATIEAMRS